MRLSNPALCVLFGLLWACTPDLKTIECLASSDCDGGFCSSGVCRGSLPQDDTGDTELDSNDVFEGDLTNFDLHPLEDPVLDADSDSEPVDPATDPIVEEPDSHDLSAVEVISEDPITTELVGVDATVTEISSPPCGGPCDTTSTCVEIIVNDALDCDSGGESFCAPNEFKFKLRNIAAADGAFGDLSEEEVNSLLNRPLLFTLIGEGRFLMGTDGDDPARSPRHEVELGSFYIQNSEVTVADYLVCANLANNEGDFCNTGHILTDEEGSSCIFPQTFSHILTGIADRPINCIDRAGAQQFCEWIGGRLPTEAEWEKAARGGCDERGELHCEGDSDAPDFPWGNDEPEADHACWNQSQTCQVDQHEAGNSIYGLFDMAGNVSEWVIDGYNADVYDRPDVVPPDVPFCPHETGTTSQPGIVRGGAHNDGDEDHISVTIREPMEQDLREPATGFRCVIDVTEDMATVDLGD